MAAPEMSMPVAVLPTGADPATFFATFAGNLAAFWSPTNGLLISVAAAPDIARLHAPIKAAIKFAPAGFSVGNIVVARNTLFLQTWPMTYLSAKEAIGTSAPAEIRIENVDALAVRAAVSPLFTAIGRSDAAVDIFMAGKGLLKVEAGATIGAAAPDPAAPAATPNRVKIQLFDGSGFELNPVQFLSDVATHAGIDKNLHPLLAQLDLDGWIEVVVVDEKGAPIAAEPYILYLGDGTTRSGTTGPDGRIYEAGIPAGNWGIDLPNLPSFSVMD